MKKTLYERLQDNVKDGDFNALVTVKDFSKATFCDEEKEWKNLILKALGPTIVNSNVDFKVRALVDGTIITHISTKGKKVVPYLWNSIKEAKTIRLEIEAQQNIKDRNRVHIFIRM